MAQAVGSLFVDLSVNSAAFVSDLGKAQRALDSNSARMNRSLGTLTRMFNLSAASVAGLGVAAGIAAVGGLYVMTRRAVETANKIGQAADKIGLGVEAFQELGFAAEIADINQRTFEMGLQRFSRRIAEAVQGQGELKGTLQQYGIQVVDTEGKARSLEAVLADYADTIASAGSQQEQLRLAFKAFDSEGAVMVNLMRRGSDGIQELRDEARRLGVVISADMVAQAKQADAELRRLERLMSSDMTQAFLHLAPVIESVAGWMLDLAKAAGEVSAWLAGPTSNAIGAVSRKIEILEDQKKALESGELVPSFQTVDEALGITQNQLDEMKARLKELQDLRDLFNRPGATGGLVDPKTFKDVTEVIDDQSRALGDEAAQLRMSAPEWERLKAVQAAVAFAKEHDIVLTAEHVQLLAEQSDEVARQAQLLEEARAAHERLEEQTRRNEQMYSRMSDAAAQFLTDLAFNADNARDAVLQLVEALLQAFLQAQLFGPLNAALTSLLGGSAAPAAVPGGGTQPLPVAMQHGADFIVGGRGGTDANLVPLALTKGERVTVQPAGEARRGGGPVNQYFFDMRGASLEAVQRLERLVFELNNGIEGRAVAATSEAFRRGVLR